MKIQLLKYGFRNSHWHGWMDAKLNASYTVNYMTLSAKFLSFDNTMRRQGVNIFSSPDTSSSTGATRIYSNRTPEICYDARRDYGALVVPGTDLSSDQTLAMRHICLDNPDLAHKPFKHVFRWKTWLSSEVPIEERVRVVSTRVRVVSALEEYTREVFVRQRMLEHARRPEGNLAGRIERFAGLSYYAGGPLGPDRRASVSSRIRRRRPSGAQ